MTHLEKSDDWKSEWSMAFICSEWNRISSCRQSSVAREIRLRMIQPIRRTVIKTVPSSHVLNHQLDWAHRKSIIEGIEESVGWSKLCPIDIIETIAFQLKWRSAWMSMSVRIISRYQMNGNEYATARRSSSYALIRSRSLELRNQLEQFLQSVVRPVDWVALLRSRLWDKNENCLSVLTVAVPNITCRSMSQRSRWTQKPRRTL